MRDKAREALIWSRFWISSEGISPGLARSQDSAGVNSSNKSYFPPTRRCGAAAVETAGAVNATKWLLVAGLTTWPTLLLSYPCGCVGGKSRACPGRWSPRPAICDEYHHEQVQQRATRPRSVPTAPLVGSPLAGVCLRRRAVFGSGCGSALVVPLLLHPGVAPRWPRLFRSLSLGISPYARCQRMSRMVWATLFWCWLLPITLVVLWIRPIRWSACASIITPPFTVTSAFANLIVIAYFFSVKNGLPFGNVWPWWVLLQVGMQHPHNQGPSAVPQLHARVQYSE